MTRAAWAVAVAALVAAGVALATCRRDAPEIETPPPAPSPAPRRAEPAETPRRRRTDDGFPPAPTAEIPSAAAGPLVDGFPALDVEVVDADGRPAAASEVYAAPAGVRILPKLVGVAAVTDGAGKCRLVLPRFGACDVLARSGAFRVRARGVVLPRAEPIRLTLPGPADVVVRCDADVAAMLPKLDRRASFVSLMQMQDDGLSGSGTYLQLPAGDAEERRALAAGVRVSVHVDRRFVATPDSFVPPATVRVRTSGRRPVRLSVHVVDASDLPIGWIVATIDVGPGEEPIGFVTTTKGRAAASSYEVWPAPATTSIRWSGVGVVAEERPIPTDEPATIDVAVRLDGAPLPQSAPAGFRDPTPRHARVRVAATNGSAEPVAVLQHSDGAAGDGMDQVRPGEIATCGVQDPTWIAAVRGDLVAGPTRALDDADAVCELTFAPGGRIERVVEAKPPEALGRFTLARKDGGAIVIDGENLVHHVDVFGGAKIGPMPPGDYVFTLRLAGVEVGEVSATVVAGATTTLRIPRLPMR